MLSIGQYIDGCIVALRPCLPVESYSAGVPNIELVGSGRTWQASYSATKARCLHSFGTLFASETGSSREEKEET